MWLTPWASIRMHSTQHKWSYKWNFADSVRRTTALYGDAIQMK